MHVIHHLFHEIAECPIVSSRGFKILDLLENVSPRLLCVAPNEQTLSQRLLISLTTVALDWGSVHR